MSCDDASVEVDVFISGWQFNGDFNVGGKHWNVSEDDSDTDAGFIHRSVPAVVNPYDGFTLSVDISTPIPEPDEETGEIPERSNLGGGRAGISVAVPILSLLVFLFSTNILS